MAARGSGPKISIEDLGRAGDAGALAFYEDAAYYTKTYARRAEDVAFYVRLARALGGPVLEYGVGNGRVAIPIARSGIEVVGIDLSKPMLQDLKQRLREEPPEVRRRLRALRGDMRRARLRRRFPLIIAPFNTILHLYRRTELEQFLSRVREHLLPGGRFVFDYSMPQAPELCRPRGRRYGAPRLRHPTTGELVCYSERFEYDPLRQLLFVNIEFTPERRRPWTVPLTHRQYFPRELAALLHYNGFTDCVWTADFSDLPPDERADSLVVSCRAQGRSSRRRRIAE